MGADVTESGRARNTSERGKDGAEHLDGGEDECVDDMIFDSEEAAQDYIDEIHDSMPEGEEVLRLSGRYDESVDPGYGYGNDDLVLQIEEVE